MNRFSALVTSQMQSNVWVIPSLFCTGSLLLAFAVLAVEAPAKTLLFGDDAAALSIEAARHIHGVMASSLLGVGGVTFSITMVALTLTSGQYGPRVIRRYLEDSRSKVSLGLFLGASIFSLTCLAMYRTGDEPLVSVVLALGLTGIAVVSFIWFIHHTATDLQADKIVRRLGDDLRTTLRNYCTDPVDHAGADRFLAWRRAARGRSSVAVVALQSGYVQSIDYLALLEWCSDNDACVLVEVRAGDFVLEKNTLLRLYMSKDAVSEATLRSLNNFFLLGPIRTSIQDAEYSVTQLAQVAARALSPGINDPGTAISCVHAFTMGLAEIIDSDLPENVMMDGHGTARVLRRLTDFPGLLKAVYAPLRQMAQREISVMISLLESLINLSGMTHRQDRLNVMRAHGQLLWVDVNAADHDDFDLEDMRRRYMRLMRGLQSSGRNALAD